MATSKDNGWGTRGYTLHTTNGKTYRGELFAPLDHMKDSLLDLLAQDWIDTPAGLVNPSSVALAVLDTE